MRDKLYYLIWLFTVFFVVSCEDLEDTYDEFAGDGMIRYVGKCAEMDVQPGWGRLRVVWKNNLDATIKQVKITWKSDYDAETFVRYIDRQDTKQEGDMMDTVYLENLQNAVYTVRISNITADSTESIVEERYARPYTSLHEDLRSFTRGIVTFYEVNGKLIVDLDDDNENLKELILHFQDTDGAKHEWDIKKHMSESYFNEISFEFIRHSLFLLPEEDGVDIDFTQPITVERRGMLGGCIDEIKFDDDTLDLDEKVWSTGFMQLMVKENGPNWKDEIDHIKTVKIDYDMPNFLDLLYLPALENVILGKNRYMIEGHLTENLSTTDDYRGLMTLQFLKDIRGVKTEWYNKHYFENTWMISANMQYLTSIGVIDKDLLTRKGDLSVPDDIKPLDTKGWEVTCSDTIFNGTKEDGAGWLLDDDPKTYFSPGQALSATVFEVTFDMKTLQDLHGFKVVQYNPGDIASEYINRELGWLLSSLKIEVSQDGYVWNMATYEDGGITIGDALGETTLIYIPEALQKPVRYIRLSVASRQVSEISGGTPLFSLRLGDFIPF